MAAGRHGAARRWLVVGALVAVLAALPSVVRALPASDAQAPAARLRSLALASSAVRFSGFAQSAGGLSLPVTDQLSSLADLLSERTTMRVWWRAADDNRVDVVTATGETGIHTDPAGTWTWEYEPDRATRTQQAPIDLPTGPDLLPNTLGLRLLSEATDAELSRIGAARVAGRDALGLRITPSQPAASVSRVDVWVDSATGLPLQVRAFAKAARLPAIDTHFLDLDLHAPDPGVLAFAPPPGAHLSAGRDQDVLRAAARRVIRVPLPGTLAGLPRRAVKGAPEAVGLYGRGVTLLAVVPLSGRTADSLRRAVANSPGVVEDDTGARVATGPLSLLIGEAPDGRDYLLTGTVTLDALATAARELPQLLGAGR